MSALNLQGQFSILTMNQLCPLTLKIQPKHFDDNTVIQLCALTLLNTAIKLKRLCGGIFSAKSAHMCTSCNMDLSFFFYYYYYFALTMHKT